MTTRVVVTRPAREATTWVAALREQGLDAWGLPLIEVRPAADADALTAVWKRWGAWDGALFVSANAVDYFFASNSALAPVEYAQVAINTIALAPGPGTAQALLRHGVPASGIASPGLDSPQFDSEALWKVMQHRVGAGFRLLVVRGTTAGATSQEGQGRDWFAAQVMGRGGSVDHVVVYERGAPVFAADTCVRVEQASKDGSVWIFSSSEAIANLQSLVPAVGWSQARAVCTHPRIAQAAREAGFGVVCESRPAMDSVRASIESLR
jgi:uroporphyrinogen-III synthase